ncbi:Albumin-2 [Cladobotryum mycophilum]|uniref:Albumin-2 n=1 Tax=Cladobotryum mycophilum TaxID=491253 RepID=A0ABR0SN31_9HYPO
MPSDLTKDGALQRSTYLSNWAKASYDLLERALDKGTVNPGKVQEFKHLIEAARTSAAESDIVSLAEELANKYKIDYDSHPDQQCWRARMYHIPFPNGVTFDSSYDTGTNALYILRPFAIASPLEPGDSRNLLCQQRIYLFSGYQYARININKNEILSGPNIITSKWASLKACNFTTVDAILPLAKKLGQAYFFKGDSYALIDINPGGANDKVITGPKIIEDMWPSLRKASFNTVDAIMPHPSKESEAYFFGGESYACVSFTSGDYDDTLAYGPKSVSGYWPSLQKAFFY